MCTVRLSRPSVLSLFCPFCEMTSPVCPCCIACHSVPFSSTVRSDRDLCSVHSVRSAHPPRGRCCLPSPLLFLPLLSVLRVLSVLCGPSPMFSPFSPFSPSGPCCPFLPYCVSLFNGHVHHPQPLARSHFGPLCTPLGVPARTNLPPGPHGMFKQENQNLRPVRESQHRYQS